MQQAGSGMLPPSPMACLALWVGALGDFLCHPGAPTLAPGTLVGCHRMLRACSPEASSRVVGYGPGVGEGSAGEAVPGPRPWLPASLSSPSLVLYDACPKSLRSGVWWPQTKFGVLASVPCPRGALGEYMGDRHIAEGGDWPVL